MSIPLISNPIETCANFEARHDGRYSDGMIRIGSDSKGLYGSTKSKKKKRLKQGRDVVPAFISNQLRLESGSNPWSSVNPWAFRPLVAQILGVETEFGVVQCNNTNGLLEWLLIVIYSIFRER